MDNLKINPYIAAQTTLPILQQGRKVAPISGFGVTAPESRVSFGHLTGRTKSGPGSLLQANEGQSGLGDRAIMLANNKEAGRNLFISA